MMPLVILVSLLSVGAFLFSDNMLPVASLKMGSLLYDVRNQKAAFLIEEGVFNNSIPGYSIRVQRKDPDGQTLYGVVIYEHNSSNGNVNVLMAKKGKMYRTEDDQFLVLKLNDGVRYEESAGERAYNPRQRFMRSRFKETEQKFDLSGFKLQRTDENLFRSNYAMLNLKQLKYYRDSTQIKLDSNLNSTFRSIRSAFKLFNENLGLAKKTNPKEIKRYKHNILEILPESIRLSSIQSAQSEATSAKTILIANTDVDKDYQTRIRRFIMEYQRKFTLSVSCLILFFIGAPLGAIIRKGGLGLPVVMSIIFFLIYHIIFTIGEKSAKEGTISPIFGMWISIIVLTPVGIFLTYKATVDSALFDVDYYKQMIQKLFRKRKTAE
jgi:lipopolysaccharide export system permease protein